MNFLRFSNWLALSALLALQAIAPVFAQDADTERYAVQPGDTLEVSVWREEDLHRDVLVRPDGLFSFPLVGVKSIDGNKIYLLGQVNTPGAFVVNPRVDVMQALSLAGGTTPFASLNDIVIVRRNLDGSQRAMKFKYKDVERGRDLEQNILLESGDIVIVP